MFIEDNNLEFRKSDNLIISVVVGSLVSTGLIGAHFSQRNETLVLLCEVECYAYHEHLHRRVRCNHAEEKAGENLRTSKDEIHVRRTFHKNKSVFEA